MRRRTLPEAVDETLLELAREGHEPFELIEPALFAPVEVGRIGIRIARIRAGLTQAICQLEGLVLFEVGLFHGATQ